MLQGKNLPQVEVEQNSKDPCFYGTSDDTDFTSTHFNTHLNYFEKIIDLFDRLTRREQSRLIESLLERYQNAAEETEVMSR